MSAVDEDELRKASDVGEDEEEGDDLRPGAVFDSSEEEEDDDEEEIERIREGFIVDDEDENTPHRRKKHRRREREAKEDDALLDEDDLDLLMENSGAATTTKSKSKFKRLKKASRDEEDEPKQKTGLNDFFSDEEDEEMAGGAEDEEGSSSKPSGGRKYMDELDDFIEDDEFSDMDEEDREEARQRRKQERLKPTEISGIDSEKIDELYEIFGDGEDYAWALEGEDDDGEFRADDARPQLQDIYEPEELKARMLTDSDKVIRDNDIPERYQMMRKSIKNYELDEDDFAFEKVWVAHKMLSEIRDMSPSFDQDAFTQVIADVLTFVSKDNMDIPFIISHRRDYLLKTNIIGEGDEAQTEVESLLDEQGLWRVLQLDIEFRALLSKRNQVNDLIHQLSLEDPTVTETFSQARTLTDLQDIHDYITFTYSQQMRDLGLKKSQKQSIYEKVRSDRLYELVKAVGIAANDFAENIIADARIYPALDPKDTTPTDLAEDICMDENTLYTKVSQALEVTKRFYAEQLFTNLKIRSNFRTVYGSYTKVKIELTEQGRFKIDKNSAYADFKYAINRSHESFYDQPDLFLRMLEAEAQHLVTIKFEVVDSEKFFASLFHLFSTDGESDIATAWNSFRRDILNLALKKLIPLVTSSIKEEIRRECERMLFFEVRNSFLKKIDQAPYRPPGKNVGDIPRVFAVSPGNGKFGMDAVVGSVLDETGKLIETYKFVENPRTPASRLAEGEKSFEMAFIDAVKQCQPDVVAINGFNVNTNKLYKILQNILTENDIQVMDSNEQLQVIYVTDEVAVRYQNSQRAIEEFPDKPSLVRYTVGLARYVQSPLLEYVNLGPEVLSLSIHKHQGLLNEDKFKDAIESAFVDIVNMVGVDINKCVSDSYLASVLPYISGLGERKAVGLLRAVQQHPLFSRQGLIMNDNMKFGPTIFTNCASFLRIPQTKHRSIDNHDEIQSITVLDDTRIHPEDYALAEKMAADALDYDEDKIEQMKNALPGETIIDNLLDMEDRGSELLKSLVLEDYSRQLEEAYQKKKRATLQMILEELEDPYAELRATMKPMKPEQVFEALTGESVDTFYVGSIIPVLLKKVNDFRCFAVTTSRIDCNASSETAKEANDNRRLTAVFQEGQTVPAKLLNVDYENLTAEIALSPSAIRTGAERVNFSRSPDVWDVSREQADMNVELQQKISQQRATRVINHPLFRNYNAGQAQTELAPKERGAAVIRPSSLGNNHIAITWKVDNNLYQHINVVEHEKENEFSMGKYLTIDKDTYQDLDEILDVYVGEIAKRVSQMTQSDKFHKGTHDEVVEWIENFSKANPKRGVYCFSFNYKRPGSFLLLFKTDPSSKLYTWNVRATPKGFDLNGYNYSTMDDLRNGFKTLIKNQNTSQQPSGPHYNNNSRYNAGGYNNGYNARY